MGIGTHYLLVLDMCHIFVNESASLQNNLLQKWSRWTHLTNKECLFKNGFSESARNWKKTSWLMLITMMMSMGLEPRNATNDKDLKIVIQYGSPSESKAVVPYLGVQMIPCIRKSVLHIWYRGWNMHVKRHWHLTGCKPLLSSQINFFFCKYV